MGTNSTIKQDALDELMTNLNDNEQLKQQFNSAFNSAKSSEEREKEHERKRLAEKEKIFEQQLQKCANKPDNRLFKDAILSVEDLELFAFNMFKQGFIAAVRNNKDVVEAYQNLDIHEKFNMIREKRT